MMSPHKGQMLYFLCRANANEALKGSWHVSYSMIYGATSHSMKGNFLTGQEPWQFCETSTRGDGTLLGLGA